MTYSIVFSSHTGNTANLAEVLKGNLRREDCVYFGGPKEEALAASVIFTGFWTDKGDCDEAAGQF